MEPDKEKTLRALDFLKDNKIATLATISSDGTRPQASLIYYITDENFHIFVVTSTESRKIRNIFKNNRVALVIGQETPPLVLQIEGEVKIVDDQNKKREIANRYLDVAGSGDSNSGWPPLMKIPSESGFMMLEITIKWFKFSDFTGTEAIIIKGTPEDWRVN